MAIMTENDRENRPPNLSPAKPARDRRRSGPRGAKTSVKPRAVGQVNHDDLGNAVWEWRVDVPLRRDDDPTLDLMQCLDVDGLSLEDDAQKQPDKASFNPYDKVR